MRKGCVVFLFLLCSVYSAQVRLQLLSDSTSFKISYKTLHTTTARAYDEIRTVLSNLHNDGFLLAGVDSLRDDSTHLTAWLSIGKKFKLGSLAMGNLNPELYARLSPTKTNKSFSYPNLAAQQQKVITWYENHGYPFVQVRFDSLSTTDNKINLEWQVQPDKLYKIDSIVLEGDLKISRQFLYRYLGIHQGMPYNEELFASLSTKLRQLAFLKEKTPMTVRLTSRYNKLIFNLDKKNASQFDGIVGILPNPITNKAVITGDLKLKLVNGVMRAGETVDIEWRRLQSQTQDVNIKLIYPFLAGTPVGSDAAIKIYRKDTTFIDVLWSGGIQYYLKGLNHFKIYYKQRDTRLLGTGSLQNLSTLPEYADITTRAYGVGWHIEQLDYRFNPGKGYSIIANFQTGNRDIKKNDRLSESAYEGVLLRSLQFQGDLQASVYLPLGGQHVLRIGAQGATVFGNSVLFKNELFRFGGLKTLRGFDEESLYASSYIIPTLEYRFRFSENSAILLFGEGAWYENTSNRQYLKDTPLSVGAGINLDTRAGILTMHYAIGNQFNNGFDIRSGKIHIGLVALF